MLEVLVATAVTLLMMISLAQVFKIIGDSMKQGRAALQLNNTLRSVSFRLRHDLNNLTIRVDPPADSSCGSGYFEYYDGAMTDFTCMLFDPNNGMDSSLSTDNIRSSRIGDMDDILMYTVRAGDAWFTGKVPQYILNQANPSGAAAQYAMVTISAQHAEVAVFARPLDLDLNGAYDDADGDDMPDGFQLYYRTLLIRPDLNMSDGALPYDATNATSYGPQMIAGPQGSGLPTPACDMALAHQQCDLSIRRVFDASPSTSDRVAANSLEDLMDPANRFAHVRLPITGTSSTTMPVLALDMGLGGLLDADSSGFDPLYNNSTTLANAGFLHPAFVLGQLGSTAIDDVRIGEDLFASDVLAFDVKGYDSAVPLIGTNGADGVPAAVTVANFGAAGSDDIVLTPNDPAYAYSLSSVGSSAAVIGYGGYVDLMWARKAINALPYYSASVSSLPDRLVAGQTEGHYLATELSGYGLPTANNWNTMAAPNLTILPLSTALYQSGKALRSSSGALMVLQPTFDTWTTRYESDGVLQAPRGSDGIVQINGITKLYNSSAGNDIPNAQPVWRQTAIDAGTDGIDNNGNGIDDLSEQETMPPFPGKMRGVRVSVRLEDKATRQVRQMSVANEFVTQ